MDYLIDTHILIWFVEGSDRLSKRHINVITNPQNAVYVSLAIMWEIAIKISLGKLKLSIPFSSLKEQLSSHNFIILDQNYEDFELLATLPFHHSDPFDRLIISQALTRSFHLISSDSKFVYYKGQGLELIN